MATIGRRKLKNGSAVRYRVKWRTGGTGQWDGETGLDDKQLDLLA